MSGYPTGRTGDRGDQTEFYVPKFYVPFLLPGPTLRKKGVWAVKVPIALREGYGSQTFQSRSGRSPAGLQEPHLDSTLGASFLDPV